MPVRGAPPRWWPLLAGALSGALYALSLPKADQGWLAWFCLVPLFLILHRGGDRPVRYATLAGYVSGLVAGLGRVYWVGETLQLYGRLTAAEAWVTTGLMVAYLALYPLLFVLLCSRLPYRSPAFPWLAASLWTLLDWVQTWMISGFPWALLGYTQYRSPVVTQLAALAGVHGLTFLIVLVNAAVAQAIAAPMSGRRLVGALPAAAALAAVLVYGSQRLEGLDQADAASRAPVRVGIVQGNVRQDVKWKTNRAAATTVHYVEMTQRLVEKQGPLDLIVWPETALPYAFDHLGHQRDREQVADLARAIRTPLLVGSLGSISPSGRRGLYNRSFLIDRDGEVSGTADKVHLVPFGEYLPMPWLFSYLQGLIAESGAFDPGEAHVALPVPGGGMSLGVFICYESIFPGIPRALALAGADLLVNTTNDACYSYRTRIEDIVRYNSAVVVWGTRGTQADPQAYVEFNLMSSTTTAGTLRDPRAGSERHRVYHQTVETN